LRGHSGPLAAGLRPERGGGGAAASRAGDSSSGGNLMKGWFELHRSSDGQFHFVLKAGNAEVILGSERYTTRAAAENGIASVRANCADDARYERRTASDGRYHFNLKAANHQVIGSSQLYASQAAREAGINSVKANGQATTVKDQTGG